MCKRDFNDVERITASWEFKIEPDKLEAIIVAVNEDDKVVAIGSLSRILESMLVVDKDLSHKDKAIATQIIMDKVDGVVKELGYKSYHAFGMSNGFNNILKKKFSFSLVKGLPLIKWV